MRIILVTLGSFGDVNPFIWMGKIFRESGNEVIFVANPYFEEIIKKEGFAFHPAGTVQDYEQATIPEKVTGSRFRDQVEAIRASRRLFNYMFMRPTKEIYTIISELKNQDTVIFGHFYAYGARLAAEKHGIPYRNVCLSPYWLKTFRKINSFSAFLESRMIKGTNRFIDGQLFTKPMNEIRAEIGLDPLQKSSTEWMFDGENSCLFPEWFVGYQLLDTLNTKFIGFPDPESTEKSLPTEILEFLKVNEKPVVFTPGSAFKNVEGFLDAAVYALRKLNKPGIFLTRNIGAIPQSLPDNIIHADFVPLELLMEHCSALVHHGGIGTCYQALKAGIPQIICYRMGEQMENARVLKELGICRTIAYREVKGESMYRNIEAILHNTDVAAKCEVVKKKLEVRSSRDELLGLLKGLQL